MQGRDVWHYKYDFCLRIDPPRTTAQQKKVTTVGGKVRFYEPKDLAKARVALLEELSKHRPSYPIDGLVYLKVSWNFKTTNKKLEGKFKVTRPDTDNLQKLLKDCMTSVGFWIDDAQVALEYVDKRWAKVGGIYIQVLGCADMG